MCWVLNAFITRNLVSSQCCYWRRDAAHGSVVTGTIDIHRIVNIVYILSHLTGTGLPSQGSGDGQEVCIFMVRLPFYQDNNTTLSDCKLGFRSILESVFYVM